LVAAGYDVEVLDLNALWFRSIFTRSHVGRWRDEFARELAAVDGWESWTFDVQRRVAELVRCLGVCDVLDPEGAIDVFRSERFYDYDAYLWARQQVRDFEVLLSRVYAPYDFATAFETPVYVPNAGRLVRDALACRPLIEDIADLLRRHCRHDAYLICGVSMPFTMHLMPGMATLAALKAVFPDARRVAGGTAISDIYKYKLSPDALVPFGQICNHFYVGEAEPGVALYAEWCRGHREEPPPQVVDLRGLRPGCQTPRPAYVALSSRSAAARDFVPHDWRSNPPDYGWIDWDLYLSPERQVNYSPTRGCFWNKCTFCDYGLNDDTPAAPSRTMDVETVVEHLKTLADQGTRWVYFAVDAIAPNFLRTLAERLIAEELHLHWSGEFFLTKSFTWEFVDRLARSGLVTASFGLESGSSGVLERMGKGVNRVEEVLIPTFEAFARSPIGLQPKYFFGFPGETDVDRQSTVDLLFNYRDVFSVITPGDVFDLSYGSIVAKDPAKYGITRISRKPDDDIGGGLDYELAGGEPTPNLFSYQGFNRQLDHLPIFERPWAGGIDTFHSKLYIVHFGRGIFHRLRDRRRNALTRIRPPRRVSVVSHFDLDEVTQNVRTVDAVSCPIRSAAVRAVLGAEFDEALAMICAPLPRLSCPRRFDICFDGEPTEPELAQCGR
jgi:hypothetical protein